jgi:signal transduction histidine kinase
VRTISETERVPALPATDRDDSFRRAPAHWTVVVLAYVVAYTAAAAFTQVRATYGLGTTPWHPTTGLTVALLMLLGARALVPAAIVGFVTAVTLQGGTPAVSAAFTLATLTPIAVLGLIARARIAPENLDGRSAALFAGAASIAAAIAGGAVAATLRATGALTTVATSEVFLRLVFADLGGILCITPLALALASSCGVRPSNTAVARTALVVAGVAVTFALVWNLPDADQLRFFYILFLPVMGAALWGDWRGALVAALTIHVVLIEGVRIGIHAPRFTDLQLLLVTLTVTGLILGAVVAERRRAVAALLIRDQEQSRLLEALPQAIVVAAPPGNVRAANRRAAGLFGWTETAGRSVEQLMIAADTRDERPATTHELLRADGSRFAAEVTSVALGPDGSRAIFVSDVSERAREAALQRERDRAFARATQVATAGELATSVAHELNQPITALVGYLELARLMVRDDGSTAERVAATLDKALVEALRSGRLLGKLREFYASGVIRRESVDVEALCQAAVDSFAVRARVLGVELVAAHGDARVCATADPAQLEIVLRNLIGNALEAVADLPPERRRVRVQASAAADGVRVGVEDGGMGVATELAGRIFDPQITTKQNGMGLGLAISRTIVLGHGGSLVAESSAALGGARFELFLPAVQPAGGAPAEEIRVDE